MAQLLRLVIITAFLAIAASEFLPFPGGDTKFHEWLNLIYTRSTIDPTTMNRVKEYVERTIRQIVEKMKANNCFDMVELRGSVAEDLKIVEPDEFDFVLKNTRDKDNIVLNEKQGLPGFAYAMKQGAAKTCFDDFQLRDPKGAIDPVKTRDYMKQRVVAALEELGIKTTVTEVGPAINFFLPSKEKTFSKVDIDLVLYVQQVNWPKSASVDLKPALKDLGVGLVPKVLDEDKKVWQISFSAIEIQLFKDIDADGGIRRKLLRVAKFLKYKTKWPITVSSYHLKTIIMKLNANNPKKDFWSEENFVARFRDLMQNFHTSLKTKSLPSFFIPSFDLFRGKDLTDALKVVDNMIQTIEKNPNSLLPPPRVAACKKPNKAKKRSLKEKLFG